MVKVYAEGGPGKPSTTKTADDRAYTAWAKRQAAAAGVKNPSQYVENNVARNAGPASRNRVVGQTVNRNRG